MASIWGSTNVAPTGTGRIPKDVSSSGAPSHVTEQQLADLDVTVGKTVQALGSINTNTTITISNGGYVTATIAGALTFTFSGAPTGGVVWNLVLTNGGSATITWPGSVSWTGGTAPTLRTSGVDILRFHSADGGTTWVGELAYDEQNIDASDITSGTLDAARLPLPTTTTIGGVKRNTGSAGQYVTGVDASGNLTYDTPAGGGSPGGSSGQVQYNNAGAFGGMSGVTWDAINSRISFGAGASPVGKVHVQSGAASEVALVVQGAASQTAALQEWRDSAGTVLSSITTNRRINFGPAYVGIGADTNFIHIAPGGSVSMNVVTNRIEMAMPVTFNSSPGTLRRAIGSIARNSIPATGNQPGGGGTDLAFVGTNGLNNNTATNREADGFTFITGNGGAPVSGDANGGDGGNFNVALGAAGSGSGSGSPGAPGRLIVKDRSGNIRFSVDQQGNVFFGALPTSSAGLPVGAVWNDGGTLKIVV